MTINKCNNNKKTMYLSNPNALNILSDHTLQEAYRRAKNEQLEPDFIELLETELQKRDLID